MLLVDEHLTNHDASHGMLVAVLMSLGGSIDLPHKAFDPDVTGTTDGTFHSVELVLLDDNIVRLQVVAHGTQPRAV